jgi:hypothetical protein
MSDARLFPPTAPAPPHRGRCAPAGHVAPAEATQAVRTLLRYTWGKVRDHVRHSYPWIILCAYLLYGFWSRAADKGLIPAEPVAGSKAIVGTWFLEKPQYTVLEFLSDGTVISRTALKVHKGTYAVKESRISIEFPTEPLFWDPKDRPKDRPLPDRFAISGNELSLYATSDGTDIGTARVYRFKRKAASDDTRGDLAAWQPTQ